MMHNAMNNQSNIERIVMRRVRVIRALRPFVSSGALSLLIFVLALLGIGREVWVAKVFANGPQDFFGHLAYLSYAFGHTRLVVQALSLAALAALIYSAREFVRALAPRFFQRTA